MFEWRLNQLHFGKCLQCAQSGIKILVNVYQMHQVEENYEDDDLIDQINK